MRATALLACLSWCLAATSVAARAEVMLAPGQPLTPQLVADLVHEDLVAQGLNDGLTVEVQVPAAALPNRAATPLRVALADLHYEADTGRFRARLEATLHSGEAATLSASGRVHELIAVAVPARPIARGETIGAADLVWTRLAAASLRGDTVRRPEDMVGLRAARALPAGRPARQGDLAAPWLVRRGEPTSMRFSRGGLAVAGVGTALDQGRMGEAVRVQNTGSGEVRRGIVTGPREVQVDAVGATP